MRTSKKETFYVVINVDPQWAAHIPTNKNPTVMHQAVETAKAEAERLATHNPGQTFVVFKAIGCAKKPAEPQLWSWEVPIKPSEIPW